MTPFARVLAIALRPARSAAMVEVNEAAATRDGGLTSDRSTGGRRGITLLSRPQWDQVIEAMALELPWHARRANVLLDAASLTDLVGRTIQLGNVRVAIHGVTHPCSHIDELHPGLLHALSGGKGGVYGQILNDGIIHVGDAVAIESPSLRSSC